MNLYKSPVAYGVVAKSDTMVVQPQVSETFSLTEVPILFSQAGWGPVEINTSIGQDQPDDGNPITINGVVYATGIGTHSTSVIAYDLEGKCSTFSSDVGIDDEVGPDGSVVFQLFGDQQKLYDSGLMTGADPAKSTGDVNITDVQELLLIVTDGGDIFHEDHADWANPQVVCESLPNGDGAEFRHVRGYWDPVMEWPVKAIHASLLPSGHILSHASSEPGAIGSNDPTDPHNYTKVDLADIAEWNHEWVDHQSEEMYCSSHTLLGDGSVFEFGGHGGANPDYLYYGQDQASIFDFATKTWTVQTTMNQPRWYPSAVTLGNGHVMAIGGSHAGGNSFTPEIWSGNSWRTLGNASYESRINNNDPIFDHTYPFVQLTTDGRVFWAGWDQYMAYLDPTGDGLWSQNYLRENIQRQWGTPVMYQLDKILLAGGVDPGQEFGLATKSAVTINLTGGTPVASPTSPMLFPRADVDGTILADGTVMVNGGGYDHILGASPTHIYLPEIWSPDTGKWTLGTPATNPRGYHSSSLLLPDGRVWTGGGECGDGCDKGMTAQIFWPPYLFKNDGSGAFATRAVINSVPERISYGASFELDVSSINDVSKVTFIRLGSTTHHINFEQRYLELDFTQDESKVTAVAPDNGNMAPPGFYMLFVIDDEGVPSEAKMVQILPFTPTPPSCNLLKNADFELGLLHWTDHGGAAPTSDAESGTGALSISGDWIGQQVDVTPGKRYIYSGFYKTGATFFELTAGVDFLNSSGTEIGEEQIRLLDAPEYTPFSLATTVPVGTAKIQFWLYSDTGSVLLADTLDAHEDGCVENVPPTLDAIADRTNIISDTVSLALMATDPENNVLTFGVDNLPSGLGVEPSTGLISGTLSAVGLYTVTVTVTDTRGGVDSAAFLWTVNEIPNAPPAITSIRGQASIEGVPFSLAILAMDPENQPMTYAAEGLPPGVMIDSMTGTISGLPSTAGSYNVTVIVTDGRGGSATSNFSWLVSKVVNSPPIVTEISEQVHAVGDAIELQVLADDPDINILAFTATGLPPGLTINSVNGLISGTVTKTGVYNVAIAVIDADGARTQTDFVWQVKEKSGENATSGQTRIYLPHISK